MHPTTLTQTDVLRPTHMLAFMLIAFAFTMVSSLVPRNASAQIQIPQIPLGESDFLQQWIPAGVAHLNVEPGDQVWIVSTRNMTPQCEIDGHFSVAKYVGGQFLGSSLMEFQSDVLENPALQNVVHIHGDFTDLDWAIRRGFQVYENSISRVCNRGPVRFVVWAWRAERTAVPIRDFRIKTAYSLFEGKRFASFVRQTQLPGGVLIGYSLGAQTALTAVNEFATQYDFFAVPWRLIIVAPSLSPEYCPLAGAMGNWDSLVNDFVLIGNAGDRALRTSRRINSRTGGAINQHSLTKYLPLPWDRIATYDVMNEVGKKHTIARYSATSPFCQTMANWLLTPLQSAELTIVAEPPSFILSEPVPSEAPAEPQLNN